MIGKTFPSPCASVGEGGAGKWAVGNRKERHFSPPRGEGPGDRSAYCLSAHCRATCYSLFPLPNNKKPAATEVATGSLKIIVKKTLSFAFGRPGSDLLSQVLRHSTI